MCGDKPLSAKATETFVAAKSSTVFVIDMSLLLAVIFVMSDDDLLVDETSANDMLVDEMLADEMLADDMSTDEMSAGISTRIPSVFPCTCVATIR